MTDNESSRLAWLILVALLCASLTTCAVFSPEWNDAPNRTQPEVVATPCKAADLARADGQ